MLDWIFQADHPVDDEVAQQPEDWWNTPQHRSEISVGDRVWLQVSGRHNPGLYYVATVVRPVYESTERVYPERPAFGRWRTDIRFEYRIVPPLLRSELLEDPELASFQPFHGFQGSNRPVPMAISSKLLKLATLVPLAK
jgi:EVE domain